MPDTTPPLEHPPLSLIWEPMRTDAWPDGLPISRNYFRESVWKPAIAAAGLPHRSFHALLASHSSWLLAGGLDLPSVMKRVGHTQFTTTERYTAVMAGADERALEALDVVRQRYTGGPRAVGVAPLAELWGYRIGDDVEVRRDLRATSWMVGRVTSLSEGLVVVEVTDLLATPVEPRSTTPAASGSSTPPRPRTSRMGGWRRRD